jgi:hypothetical protein
MDAYHASMGRMTDQEQRDFAVNAAMGLIPFVRARPVFAPARGGGSGGRAGRGRTSLPMDTESREARARQLGYSDERFWRGEMRGGTPMEYSYGPHFSRDREVAAGFAARSGQQPREFRLRLGNALRDYEDFTAEQYGRIIRSALDTGDRKLAEDLAQTIAPGRDIDWVLRFARDQPDAIVARPAAHVRLIVQASKNPDRVFLGAGFDALDSGRDVRMLTERGIRLKGAAFDPSKAESQNLLASLTGVLGAGALSGPPERE